MNDVFNNIGKVVGKSFYGRNKFIEKLKQEYFEKQYRTAKAFVGLPQIGKSSCIANIFIDIPKDIIYIYEDLKRYRKYNELWKSICKKISNYLKKNDSLSDYIAEYLDNIKKDDIEWVDFLDSIETVFGELSNLCKKVIIVLDNFDEAKTLFESDTAYWMIFRSIFSEPQYNVSAITISRRSLTFIEDDISQSSNFSGIFDSQYIQGFDDEDIKKYYKIFEDIKIKLDEKQKKEIEYYCGRLPYLLSIMGQEILKFLDKKEQIDIQHIFEDKRNLIDTYYKKCKKYISEEQDYPLDKPKYFEEHESEFVELKETTETTKYEFSLPKTETEWKELIAKGECGNIEFKSTLQYDTEHGGKVPPDVLRFSSIKTVAAFLNTDGGILLIGIEDKEKNILGLENDYSTFGPDQKKDKDEFELIFRDLLKSNFGIYNTADIKFLFPIIDGKEVCAVIVKPSSEPVYAKDKKDSTKEIFYIRYGNKTEALKVSEVTNYINSHKHFKK